MLTAPLAAHSACDDAELSFIRTFRGQFVLTKSPDLTIEKWRVTDLDDGWRLHHCRSLPYARILAHDGTPAGILLGLAVDASGTLIRDGYKLSFGETEQSFATGTAGRYVIVTPTAVFADPTGSMGGVYDASSQTVASTVLMCLDRDLVQPEGFNRQAIIQGRGAYSLGHTADANVMTITPNHRLDLTTFELARFWPTKDVSFERDIPEPREVIAAMAARLSAVIGAIANDHQTLLPLTGGRDSRNLAAAAKPHLEKIEHMFTFVSNWQGQIDAEVATQIANALGGECEIYTSYTGDAQNRQSLPKAARMRQRRAFRLAGGFVGDANNDVLDGLALKIPKGVVLRGNVMEILKANHWKRGLSRDREHPSGHDVDYAVARLAIQPEIEADMIAQHRDAYLKWHSALPLGARRVAYDFAFIEHLLPGWQSKFFGYTRNFFLNPFNDRALIEGSMQLPVQARQSNAYNDALLAQLAPELTDIPFTPDIKKARKSVA